MVEIDNFCARIEGRSPRTRDWNKSHVTVEQVQTWTGNILEVAPCYIGDLISGMLANDLKILTIDNQILEDRV